MLTALSEAVRNLNVATQKETNGDSLGHHGETAADAEIRKGYTRFKTHEEHQVSSIGTSIELVYKS